jgi:hypothetical protein
MKVTGPATTRPSASLPLASSPSCNSNTAFSDTRTDHEHRIQVDNSGATLAWVDVVAYFHVHILNDAVEGRAHQYFFDRQLFALELGRSSGEARFSGGNSTLGVKSLWLAVQERLGNQYELG